jgi:hypothetical protein
MHVSTHQKAMTKRLNLVVEDELEENFRNAVFRAYGMKKGNIQKAVEEALGEWIAKHGEKKAAPVQRSGK